MVYYDIYLFLVFVNTLSDINTCSKVHSYNFLDSKSTCGDTVEGFQFLDFSYLVMNPKVICLETWNFYFHTKAIIFIFDKIFKKN